MLISWAEIHGEENSKVGRGIVMSLVSAFFYAAYLVLVKRKSDTEEKINIPLFFGNLTFSEHFSSPSLIQNTHTFPLYTY